MKAVIRSDKHYVHFDPGTVVLGAATSQDMVQAVEATTANAVDEVAEGSVIKAVYLELWLTSDDATASSFTFTIEKQVGGIADITAGAMAALGVYANKKNIFYASQGLVGPNTGTIPLPVFKDWIKVPKGKQRFGLGDVLVWNLRAISDGLTFCGFCTYKEFS